MPTIKDGDLLQKGDIVASTASNATWVMISDPFSASEFFRSLSIIAINSLGKIHTYTAEKPYWTACVFHCAAVK